MSDFCTLPVRKNSRRKYDAVVKASCQLFLRFGYSGTSMDAIAKKAGVSKQTVYSYFKNKDDLFCKMVENECIRHSPPDSVLDNPELAADKALFYIGRSYLELILSQRGLEIHRLVCSEAGRYPHIAKLFFDCGPAQVQNLLVTFLNLHNGKEYKIDDTDLAATYFYSLIKGRYQLRMLLGIKPTPTKSERDEHVRHVGKIFNKVYAR